MSKSSRIWFSIFAIAPLLASFLSAVIRKPDGSVYRLSVYGKEPFQVHRLDQPPALALKHDELDERAHLVEPAKKPDKKDDRDRYADQPEQKTSTQAVSSDSLVAQANVAFGFKFPFAPAIGLPRSIDLW